MTVMQVMILSGHRVLGIQNNATQGEAGRASRLYPFWIMRVIVPSTAALSFVSEHNIAGIAYMRKTTYRLSIASTE